MTEAFRAGERVTFNGVVDYCPHAIIAKGERGTVVDAVDDDGMTGEGITVKLDRKHEGLGRFDNSVYLVSKDVFRLSPLNWRERASERAPRLLKVAGIIAAIIFMPAPWNYHQAAQAIEKAVYTVEADLGIVSTAEAGTKHGG